MRSQNLRRVRRKFQKFTPDSNACIWSGMGKCVNLLYLELKFPLLLKKMGKCVVVLLCFKVKNSLVENHELMISYYLTENSASEKAGYWNWIMSWPCSYIYMSCMHWLWNLSTPCRGFPVCSSVLNNLTITIPPFLLHTKKCP